ncbi:MAG: hypothetical protein HQK64_04280 [Desulfamplus sp.]|nr:hypothetical protein [Desulfamplus sp.]MBF0389046.1 hypothetical protein [Desulfamplus sp.]
MKIDKNKFNKLLKYTLVVLPFCAILLLPRTTGESHKISLIAMQYDELVEKYEVVKQAEQSDLKKIFIKIINTRLKCYSETSDYSLRLSECRKNYQYAILRAARENLKSSPSLGDFMLCTQDCPLAYSFCNGEELSEGESKDCREVETLCIELCLDAFWRGNSLSN